MEQSDVLKAAVSIAAVVLGAILTWSGTVYFHRHKVKSDQRRRLSVLFGELLNIHLHYEIAASELPDSLSSRIDVLRLKMSEYGEVSYTGKALAELNLLDAQTVMQLMQLILKIRNTDYAIKLIFDQHGSENGFPEYERADKEILESRMRYVVNVTNGVLFQLSENYPELKKLIHEDSSIQLAIAT